VTQNNSERASQTVTEPQNTNMSEEKVVVRLSVAPDYKEFEKKLSSHFIQQFNKQKKLV